MAMIEVPGRIEVICGCMFSGKTEELLRRLRRASCARKAVAIFKPVIDDRYEPEDIASHDGSSLKAQPIDDAERIYEMAAEAEVIGIDEAQFFDEDLVAVVQALADAGRRVIVAGLDLDYLGLPFGSVPYLCAVADKVNKLSAICVICGREATRSQRLGKSAERVLVGEKGDYDARCRLHWKPEPIEGGGR
jgi:thymidine kinase